ALRWRGCERMEVAAAFSCGSRRGRGCSGRGLPRGGARRWKQSWARRWSLALYNHPTEADGIIYPSRLNGETNLAVYDRAIPKLRAAAQRELLKQIGLAAVLRDLKVGLQ